MISRAIIIWIIGLCTIVPYGTYHLFFHAPQEQYALLITLVLFWIFGYWGVVGPLLALLKVRSVYRLIEHVHAQGRLMEALQSKETQEVIIDVIASENRIPKFLAAKVYRLLLKKLPELLKSSNPAFKSGNSDGAAH